VTVSSSSSSIVAGQPIVLTATVSGNSPTGTVQFLVNGANLGTPLPLVAGVATLSTSSLTTLGTLSITAVYSGDTNDAPSTSTVPLVETVAAPQPIPALPGAGMLALSGALLLVALRRDFPWGGR
jgi:hypothetical protein